MINYDGKTDCKSLGYDELAELASELREQIIEAVSKNGGHLASNLGVVELTLALHRVFDLPKDKIIFDVSHQSYVHKLLTGRGKGFEKLRAPDGVSGFQLRSESEYDFFGGGHSGTSIAAAIGHAQACKMSGSDAYSVAVVGDGSFTNGMIFEALNNAAREKLRLIVVLNDNNMSISQNVGAISNYFGRLRTSASYYKLKRRVKNGLGRIRIIGKPIAWVTKSIKNIFKTLFIKTTLFEHFGLNYMGAFDGHNVKTLEAALNEAKLMGEPVIVHVCTHKGHGYAFAEEKPEIYHSVSSFDKEKGITEDEHRAADNEYSGFSQCFGASLLKIAERNSDVVAITAAMCEGTGLTDFKKKFPDRFFDVGIAEQYAATFAAGLAASGKRPVFAVYSSFLQRSYDQLIHDVSAQSLPVVFAVDRAGLVPGDGITHQGVFDLAFSLSIPGFSVYTPETYSDLENSLENALASNLPSIVRYNKGNEPSYPREQFADKGEYRIAHFGEGKTVNLISYGRTVKNAYDAAMLLKDKYEVRVVSILRVKPFDAVKLFNDLGNNGLTVFIEEQVRSGCFGEKTVSTLAEHGMHFEKVAIVALDEEFPTHAAVDQLHKKYAMDAASVTALVEEKMAK